MNHYTDEQIEALHGIIRGLRTVDKIFYEHDELRVGSLRLELNLGDALENAVDDIAGQTLPARFNRVLDVLQRDVRRAVEIGLSDDPRVRVCVRYLEQYAREVA
jgi:hypothetical protein